MSKTIYFHHSNKVFAILLLLLLFVASLIFIGAVGVAFANIGFTPISISLILAGTLFGSTINIPLMKIKSVVPIIREEYVRYFWVTYRIPYLEYETTITTLAINVGGALIPTAVSIFLLSKAEPLMILNSLIGISIVALFTHAVARPVKGVGIVTPAFLPPIVAAALALFLSPTQPQIIAYVSGVLGTLIGADLLNLDSIPELGAPVASIGGAGTFDGVFLSGIIAVLLVGL
ncbi:MAG: DUF1614 domain-containing protein [Candidatus Bathyarchaeota archaeon]|nr:DUF1614 domain-containing protein [Candidatus Bathyarchaeota archaeon]